MNYKVTIDLNEITDRNSFHASFAKAFGFFDGYGCNMDAWIDCMGELRVPAEESITKMTIPIDATLILNLKNVKSFKERCRDLWDDLVDCASIVNFRELQIGEKPLLALAYSQ